MEAKGVNWMVDPSYDFKLWPHPWPWPCIFKVKFFNSRILGMGRSIDLESKRCELDAQWACSWATVHGKYIGQVMGRCESFTVSKLMAHEWAVHVLT